MKELQAGMDSFPAVQFINLLYLLLLFLQIAVAEEKVFNKNDIIRLVSVRALKRTWTANAALAFLADGPNVAFWS